MISLLLHEDDAVILAEDEKLMRLGLEVLMEWCDVRAVEVNAEKSGIMHMRRKGVKRTVGRFYVGGIYGDRSGGGVQVPVECSQLVAD